MPGVQPIDLESYQMPSDITQSDITKVLGAQPQSNGWLGLNGMIQDNSNLFGLAGMGMNLWNQIGARNEQKRVNDFNMDQARQRMDMTQKSYNNELYRSNAIEDQMAGGKSRYTGAAGRQYVGDAKNQPGYVAPQGLASTPVKKKPIV